MTPGTPEGSRVASVIAQPAHRNRSIARPKPDRMSPATGRRSRSSEFATRAAQLGRAAAFWNDICFFSRDIRSAAWKPVIASSINARSAMVRAIGPSTKTVSKGSDSGLRATRPGVGLRPATPQKAAGGRKAEASLHRQPPCPSGGAARSGQHRSSGRVSR